jgi:2,3-dihydroxy-p-cumate/2,3-dihydroxybenzoate 3,4-dioxygenase
MINLKDVSYVRLGSPDLATAESFATICLGLEIAERGSKTLYLRSDDRSHTLCYTEGDPADQSVGFEVEDENCLQQAAATLDALDHRVWSGSAEEAAKRKVKAFIGFNDPSGNRIELVVRPERSGRRYFPTRDAGITGFSHIGLNSTDPARDERFWTKVCNARVSDRIGDIPLMRVNAIHHTIALVRAPKAGIQHINHQVETSDDVLRSYYFLSERRVPIVFGPGRHPASTSVFFYFLEPDGMTLEYSFGMEEFTEVDPRNPRTLPMAAESIDEWGSVRDPRMGQLGDIEEAKIGAAA